MLLHDYIPGLQFGAKILPSEIVGGGLGFTGNCWYVKPSSGSDSNSGDQPTTAFKTLAKALSAATANNGDVVYLLAESNTATSTFDFQSVALDWNKDGVHLIGVSAAPQLGSRAGIRNATTATTIEDLFTVSANNCLIANLEIFMGDVTTSTATSPRAMVVSGMRNRIVNCQISGNGSSDLTMDTAGARSLAVTGPENTFQHCYIGLDTVLRVTSLAEMEITANAKRCVFEDCIVNSYTSLTTFKAILMTSGSSAHSATFLKNCMLCAETNRTSAVTPTGAILFTMAGNVFMMGGGVFGYVDVSTLDNAAIFLLAIHGYAGTAGAELVGIAQGVDA